MNNYLTVKLFAMPTIIARKKNQNTFPQKAFKSSIHLLGKKNRNFETLYIKIRK